MKGRYAFPLLITLLSIPALTFAQNIGINGTGNNPDPSAMLDVEAADKGVLIPRLQLNDASTAAPVTGPAEGLLIYNETGTEPKGYYYWDAGLGEWIMVGSNADDLYWDRDAGNGYLFPATLSDRVGIGQNNPSGRLHVSFDNGTGEHVVIDKANGSGFGPLTEWYGYSTSHSLTLGYDGAYNFSTSSSARDIEFDLNVGNDWRVETSGEPDMLYVNGGDDVLGIGKQPAGPALIAPPGVEIYKPMEIGDDAGNGDQATIGYWWSSDVAIMPENNSWGYVGYDDGFNTFAWWEMYSYGFFNPSSKERKRKITPIEGALEEKVMKDIEKLHPSFYFYNEDPESFSEDPSKYRAQMRLGLIAENAPDYVQSKSFAGVDIYASSALALAGVKSNKKRLDELEREEKEIRDIGTADLRNGKELRVEFSDAFRKKLGGGIPVLHLTSYDPSISVGIKEKDAKGFTLIVPEVVDQLKVDWIAVAKVQTPTGPKEEPEERLDPELLKRLDVPEEEKEKVIEYLKNRKPTKKAQKP